MSVFDLYQSYLNQMSNVNQNQTPGITDPNYLLYLQQQQGQGGNNDDNTQGGDNDNNTNVVDPTQANAGINSFSDLTGITGIGRLGNLASFALGGIPGVIGNNIIGAGITGIGNMFNNFRDPNTDIFGRLNEVGLAAQAQNMAQARGLTKSSALANPTTARDRAMGGGGDGPSGPGPGSSNNGSSGSRGGGMGGFGGGADTW